FEESQQGEVQRLKPIVFGSSFAELRKIAEETEAAFCCHEALSVDCALSRLALWQKPGDSARNGTRADSVPSRIISNYDWKPPSVRVKDAPEANAMLLPVTEVFVKPSNVRCTDKWPRGQVTGPTRGVSVELPRHVADIRPRAWHPAAATWSRQIDTESAGGRHPSAMHPPNM
ncbi:hypothetical protein BOX15_Mlig010848g1, partial [Macrostomum lignano]